MDALVRVVDPHEPIWPGNIEPIDGQIEMYFYDDTTGQLVDSTLFKATFTDGVFDGVAETCG